MNDFDPKLSVDLGDTVPFLWEKLLSILGKDSATLELRDWFTVLQRSGFLAASSVQCIGMHTPLLLKDIYRPTKLVWQARHLIADNPLGKRQEVTLSGFPVSPKSFLGTPTSAVIKAGPGWGKTTFLHYLFLTHAKSSSFVPVLITLRRPGSIEDLERLIDKLSAIKKIKKGLAVLLLVDGYDEITLSSRKRISDLLLKFLAAGVGRLYLTCRDFYDIIDLNLPEVRIAPFDENDQQR